MHLQYAAGLFDGEGHVGIIKKMLASKPNHIGYYISAGITMTHYPTLKAFHDQFSGRIDNHTPPAKPSHRQCFHWGISDRMAVTFLRAIRPYTVIKADEIDLALALGEHIKRNRYTSSGRNHMTERPNRDAILAYRESLYLQCKQLKKRAFAPLLKKGPWPSGRKRGRPPGR
jgi:hypothetical protein